MSRNSGAFTSVTTYVVYCKLRRTYSSSYARKRTLLNVQPSSRYHPSNRDVHRGEDSGHSESLLSTFFALPFSFIEAGRPHSFTTSFRISHRQKIKGFRQSSQKHKNHPFHTSFSPLPPHALPPTPPLPHTTPIHPPAPPISTINAPTQTQQPLRHRRHHLPNNRNTTTFPPMTRPASLPDPQPPPTSLKIRTNPLTPLL
jgi:hypothetical protein